MAITITETFDLDADMRKVWAFLLDPHAVVACMPGAALDEIVDDRTFLGTIRVKVGPVVTAYKGRVQFVNVDDGAFHIEMVAEGRESAGSGNARATMRSELTEAGPARTTVVAEARAEITGRVMQFGQSMIEGVSHQLFLDFVKRAKERLEVPDVGESPKAAAIPASATPDSAPDAVSIVPVLLRVILSAIGRFVRRLFGRGRAPSAE